MPMSDVIEQARQAKLKKRREELKKISLLHTIFIANLRVRFPNHPTTNAPWANDEELVDYSLKDATESELSYLHTELTGKPNRTVQREAANQPQGLGSFIQPLMEIITGLFKGEGGGFFGQLMGMFHKLQVAIDPSIPLNKDEQGEFEHSDLFVFAGKISAEIGKEVNVLYRKLQQETCTNEQKFNGLLRHIKGMGGKQAKEAHKLLKATEIKLLGSKIGGLDDTAFDTLADSIENEIKTNLGKAVDAANKQKPLTPLVPADLNNADVRIGSAARAIRNLVSKIREQERAIKNSSLKEDKVAIHQVMQENKRKVLQFILKTRALAQGETLSVNKPFGFTYMTEQLDKFPTIDITAGSPTLNQFTAPAQLYVRHGNKSIFKLFTNTNNGTDSTQAIKNTNTYNEAIENANDGRFKEIARQIEKAQIVVGKLHNLWVENAAAIQHLNTYLGMPGIQPQEALKCRTELAKRMGQNVQLEIDAVNIQTQINTQIADQTLLRGVAPAIGATIPNAPVDASIEIGNIVNSKAPRILDNTPNIEMPGLGVTAGSMLLAAIQAVNPSIANLPCGNHADKFNLVKKLQENATNLLELTEDAKQKYLPTVEARNPASRAAASA